MTSETSVRRFPRVTTRLTAEVWQGDHHWTGVITVLSAGGALLEMDVPFEVGSTVGVCFTPPGSATPLVCGAVVRDHILGPPGVGLQFVLAPGDGERLTQAVEVASRSTRPGSILED